MWYCSRHWQVDNLIEIYTGNPWLYCGIPPFKCYALPFPLYLSPETDFPASFFSALILLVSSLNPFLLFSNLVEGWYLNFILRITTASLPLLWDSHPHPSVLTVVWFVWLSQTSDCLLRPCWISDSLPHDTGCSGSVYFFPLFVSSSVFLSRAAQLSLHLCWCRRFFISKFAPLQKGILPVYPFVLKGYSQPYI